MELPVVNHEDYFAKIGDDHKFPINKFSELANYLIKKKVVKKFGIYVKALYICNVKQKQQNYEFSILTNKFKNKKNRGGNSSCF